MGVSMPADRPMPGGGSGATGPGRSGTVGRDEPRVGSDSDGG